MLLWPFTFKPVIITLLLISSSMNYFMYHYGIYIDADMVRNAIETNPGETADLITTGLVLWTLFMGIIPSIIVATIKINYPSVKKIILTRLIRIAITVLVLLIMAIFNYKQYAFFGRNHREIRKLVNPENYVYATFRYFKKQALANREFKKLDETAEHKPYEDDHITAFILIIGETARTQNFSLNGYGRNTNPILSTYDDVISFRNVESAGTSTAISVPAIFSNKSRKEFKVEDAKYEENFIDIIQNTGYEVLWKENDNGCKGVCNRVKTEVMDPKKNPKYCDGTYCYDEIMLEGLEEYLRNLKKDTFIVLHAIGSHGPTYYKRYPEEFKVFTPTCRTAELQNCQKEDIVNTYDNTILYTDFFLSKVINTLKKFPNLEAGMLYVSDHGESLGENGLYLHGVPYAVAPDEQTKVPMILWMSETMQREDHIDYACMKKYINEKLSHDNIFHSMVGLMEIDSKTYDKNLDMFEKCRTKPLPR